MRRAAHHATGLAAACVLSMLASTAMADEVRRPGGEPAAPETKVLAPAENIVVNAELGYGAGALSAIRGAQPKVVHGMTFHFGLGWAWPIRKSHSLGVEAFADGMLDGEATTRRGTEVGGRYGAGVFVLGERAHVRAGLGYARTRSEASDYEGLGVTFAAGFHVPITPLFAGKRGVLVGEFVPSWDFLGAGDETLHRWGVAALLGVGLY